MEVNRLLDAELTYELLIRGYPIGRTVEEKRSMLRQAFRRERNGEVSAPSTVPLNPVEEIIICQNKLSELEAGVGSFNFDNRQNEFERLHTRLVHFILRVGRVVPEDNNQRMQLDELGKEGRRLMDNLNLVYHGVATATSPQSATHHRPPVSDTTQEQPPMSILDVPNPLLPEIMHASTTPAYQSVNVLTPTVGNYSVIAKAGTSCDFTEVERAASSSQGDAGHLVSEEYLVRQFNAEAKTASSPLRVRSHDEVPNREMTTQNLSRPAVQYGDARQQSNRSNSRVRFAEDLEQPGEGDNWSRMPNTSGGSHILDTLPADTSIPLASLLKALHLSSPSQSDGLSPYGQYGGEVPRYTDLSRWNLKYDGVSSVNDFLERLEELRVSRGISKPQMLRSAAELFTRDALLWFRTNQFSSWDDLVVQLRDAFQPYDYENGIWDELRRRTQGAQEKVVVFVASMEQLFNRLSSKPTEESRIQLIKRNLLPYIQTQLTLHPVNTVRDLVKVCRSIEETEIRVQRFCPPPTNYRQLLEPELAYHKPIAGNTFHASTVSIPNTHTDAIINENSNAILTSAVSVAVPTCWNCHGTGHRFRGCDKPRRIFCFKCGYDNVTVAKCPRCSKNLQPGRQ